MSLNHTSRRAGGWLLLELLLTTALAVLVMSAGGITMFQIMGIGGGLFPDNQMQEVELSRLLLEIEKDFETASRAYVWNSSITESGGPLTHIYAGVNVTNAGGDTCNIWNTGISPTADSAFLTNWEANNTAVTGNGAISSTASVANSVQYYTLLTLSGTSTAAGVSYQVPVIESVVYLTCAYTSGSSGGMKYTLTRYENNGSNLIAGQTWSYFAPGITFSTSDQSATTTTFPSITRNGTSNSIIIRFPTAFSTALKDIQTGNQARRVKNTTDVWGLWTLFPENGSSTSTTGRWY